MGLGYALSENFTSTKAWPDSLALRGISRHRAAKHMPKVDVILIEVPGRNRGLRPKGVGEIGCVATAGAVASALHFLRRHPPLHPAHGRCAGRGAVGPEGSSKGSSFGVVSGSSQFAAMYV
jgi:hypothetical protein